MAERIFEELAVIIKQKYTVRLLEYKENGSEFTEINVYSKEVTEENDVLSDYFEFGFTVKGRAEEEKVKIEKMNEKEFEEFINHMTIFLEKKYNIAHEKIVKKEKKKEEKPPAVKVVDDVESIFDNVDKIIEDSEAQR